MTAERAALIGALAYAAAAIATFGHAAQNAATRNPDMPSDIAASAGLLAGIAWPLYWSWEAWS
ncbi:hypothetical protein UFOVP319_19 [uncultured Caudovirales phage]|uniref:Uncharacterized protein n=1 Tax=uncultured Caudovirales phage TaxID=2100421 RepID=A0A6J5LU24_9CAUD|nr:hypothetical protein UFOVP319_19 [uncultured Caudovirales phage]